MLRRLGLLALLVAMFLPLGCMTNRPVLWSWPHWKRHIMTTMGQFHEVHMDIDRAFFDMDELPLEDED